MQLSDKARALIDGGKLVVSYWNNPFSEQRINIVEWTAQLFLPEDIMNNKEECYKRINMTAEYYNSLEMA